MSFTTVLAVSTQVAADSGDDASQRLSYVIMGLVGLAVLITIATIVFWRMSRPEPSASDVGIRWVADPDLPSTPASAASTGSAASGPPAATDPSAGR